MGGLGKHKDKTVWQTLPKTSQEQVQFIENITVWRCFSSEAAPRIFKAFIPSLVGLISVSRYFTEQQTANVPNVVELHLSITTSFLVQSATLKWRCSLHTIWMPETEGWLYARWKPSTMLVQDLPRQMLHQMMRLLLLPDAAEPAGVPPYIDL